MILLMRPAVACLLTVALLPAALAAIDPGSASKIDPVALQATEAGPGEFLLVLGPTPDLSAAASSRSKVERGSVVAETLRTHAARSQSALVAELERRGVPFRPFWIANAIWVRGDRALLVDLARRVDVLRVEGNPRIAAPLPEIELEAGRASAASVEWNVVKVNAPQVWGLGYNGEGVVIGGQDTGYDWDHPALIGKYRGWDGSNSDHNYNWHDAIHSGGGSCGADSPVPCDDHSHGTHTMGTMVGDDGGVNRTGMAPGARWIGCRNMDQGDGTPATYMECFEWFVAPTDLAGQNADPARAPDVINNSWACPTSEGCAFDTLRTTVENTRAAGIVVVASAGNSGSFCSTVSAPPAIYDAAFSVGATNSSDAIASFSSRGPVIVDGSSRLKPDVSAPGVGVRSSVPGIGYSSSSGTSMAGPHVAGLVALLLDARPDLRGRVEEIEELIRRSAVPLTSTQDCGDVSGLSIPNNTFGHGRIDALALLQGDPDGDGVENLTDCQPLSAATWQLPTPARDLRIEKSGGGHLSWSPPLEPGGTLPVYRVLRSASPDQFADATCLASDLAVTETHDAEVPAGLFFYLIGVSNSCGDSYGTDSSGQAREGGGCP